MRQVPPLCIIGNGRMAQHFLCYLQQLQQPATHWHRRSKTPLSQAVASAHTVVILIPDDAIQGFIQHYHAPLKHKVLIHFSGHLEIPEAIGLHPLSTFGPTLYNHATYCQIPFVSANNTPKLSDLLPGLPNPHYQIPATLKPLYHCLCVLGGNFTTLLWQKCFALLQAQLQLPAEVMHPYLAQIITNLMTAPQQALTGPLVRQDTQTIQTHLNTLAHDPYQRVYQAFVDAYNRGLS